MNLFKSLNTPSFAFVLMWVSLLTFYELGKAHKDIGCLIALLFFFINFAWYYILKAKGFDEKEW